MRKYLNLVVLCAAISVSCGKEIPEEDTECSVGEERECGSGPCRGTSECLYNGRWSTCSSQRDSCGECCICDSQGNQAVDCEECADQDWDGSVRTECGGDDCDDSDPQAYPGNFDQCDGMDNDCDSLVDEDEVVSACGEDACLGEHFCIGGSYSDCSTFGFDCGPCCRCTSDGMPSGSCTTCEDGDVLECGSDECWGTRFCLGDAWSSCSSSGQSCGICCVCDDNGNPEETCTSCDDGDVEFCGAGECAGHRVCLGDAWEECSTMGRDCGHCCQCNEFGHAVMVCTTCEEGETDLCGIGECSGYRVCVGDSWSACSTEGRSCGTCCVCDADGNTDEFCGVCEDGSVRVCGSGDCAGYQVCMGDAWGTCSSRGDDCGVCCACSDNGLELYDSSQDSDCPDFSCPGYSGCEYGWAYCGTYGDHVHVELIAHAVGGVCTGLDACGHEECYASEWRICETDSDGDRYSETCGDCDDDDPAVRTGLAEICGDFKDNDCDGTMEEGCCLDWDGDGHIDASCGGTDCDDTRTDVYPGALEVCDGRDNDCDGGNDNLATVNIRHTTIRYIIPSSKCTTDPCCTYTSHREPGIAYSVAITGVDFTAINPAYIYVTTDVDRLYYSNTAYSDARVEYLVNYTVSGTRTQGYNFRSPTHTACGSLLTTPGATYPLLFSTAGTDRPLAVEWWVPTAGDYGVALKNFSVQIIMSCY